MAFKIVWSKFAQNERIEILKYWIHQTQSTKYSKKLNKVFLENLILISTYPFIGKKTEYFGIRALIIGDYYLFYKIKDKIIFVVSIASSHQDPKKLRNKLS